MTHTSTTAHLATDRVRLHTDHRVQARLDQNTLERLSSAAAGGEAPTARLQALDREWDVDRVLEAEAAALGLAGLALGLLADRRFLVIPGLIGLSLMLFATTGRSPTLRLHRAWGLRSSREILRERYALKALRGDFEGLAAPPAPKA